MGSTEISLAEIESAINDRVQTDEDMSFLKWILISIVTLSIGVFVAEYKLIKRRTLHFRRHRRLEHGLIDLFEKLKRKNQHIDLSRMKSISDESTVSEQERDPAAWTALYFFGVIMSLIPFLAIISLIIDFYIVNFLTIHISRHDERQRRFIAEISHTGKSVGLEIPRQHFEVPMRSFWTCLLFSIVTLGIWFIYWAYLQYKDLNDHFRAQHAWEDSLLSSLRSFGMIKISSVTPAPQPAVPAPMHPLKPSGYVAIDGSNVARYGSKEGKLANIFSVIKAVEKLGYTRENIKVFADASLRHVIDDKPKFEDMCNTARIIQTPRGAHADEFFLKWADAHDATIVSNDWFEDWADEYPWLKDRSRVMGFVIVDDEALLKTQEIMAERRAYPDQAAPAYQPTPAYENAALIVKVIDHLKIPIPNVEVILQGAEKLNATTNSGGIAEFADIEARNYIISISSPRYTAENRNIVLAEGLNKVEIEAMLSSGEVSVRVINQDTGKPLQDIPVLLESEDKTSSLESKTDANGVAIFDQLEPKKRYSVRTNSPYFSASKSGISVSERVELPVAASISLPPELKSELNYSFDMLIEQINKISPSSDKCIPKYYMIIAAELKGGIDEIAYNAELFTRNPESHKLFVQELMLACNEFMAGISRAVAQRQNLALYQKIAEHADITGMECPPLNLKQDFINKILSLYTSYDSLESASGAEYGKAMSDLYRLDEMLIKEMGKLSIAPLSSLWNVIRDMLQKSAGKSAICSLARGCLANSILHALNFMLTHPSVRKRLEVTV